MSSAFEPSTPPPFTPRMVNNSRTSSLQDTPWSKGSGSHSGFRNQHTQDDYKPYLKEDLESCKASITFDEFLTHILRVPPEWRLQQKSSIEMIVNSKRYQDMLPRYTSQIHHETERYHPFTELVNHAMEKLRDREEFVVSFCRNDPVIIKGSYAQRKPDCTGVENAVVNEGERGGVDDLSKGGPVGNPFFWTDLVSFLEFKVKASVLNARKTLLSETIGLGSNHAASSSVVCLPPVPSTSEATQSRTQSKSTKRRSKATSLPSDRVTRATANATRSSTKRVASTEQDSDILTRKRVKNNSEQSRAIAGVPDDLDLQCASYALELLSHGGLRNHVIAVAITDRKIELLYYDRSVIVKSFPIDFIDDDSRFIPMLKGFATLTPLQWGYETLVQTPHLPPRPPPLETGEMISLSMLKGQMIILSNGKVLKLGKTVYHQHGLIGRGTWVLRAKLKKGSEFSNGDDAWNRGLIVKLSWSPKSRKSEVMIINEARSHAKACGDLWVLDHLPNVMHAQDIDRTTEEPIKGLIELLGDRYEPRVLRLLVLEELAPITELATAPVLADAFRDVFKCYEWLYAKPGIFHRDISVNNMMYRKKDGKVFGVLNDYDLAIFKSNNTPSSKTRTGTKPFMAIDLLGNPTDLHRYRHDLESLFYALVYITARYHNGKEIDDPPLQHWNDLGEEALKSVKNQFLNEALPKRTPEFSKFIIWIAGLRAALRAGINARTEHEEQAEVATQTIEYTQPAVFQHETLGGHFSFDAFRQILAMNILIY